jgi:actin-related protein
LRIQEQGIRLNKFSYLKIGLAGDNFPSHSFPAMVGRPTLRADE